MMGDINEFLNVARCMTKMLERLQNRGYTLQGYTTMLQEPENHFPSMRIRRSFETERPCTKYLKVRCTPEASYTQKVAALEWVMITELNKMKDKMPDVFNITFVVEEPTKYESSSPHEA